MSATQFAMVEELASLVKDNLPCKHLVLSMEETFINFIQGDTSSGRLLELEPMNSYSRLLLHRLADIFGFAHESIGEGEDRHLILEQCADTSIPSILVSDILWQYDEPQSVNISHQLLKREEAPSVLKKNTQNIEYTLEEREAAYSAARERIFSVNVEDTRGPIKERKRIVPAVAQRMIAHALGQKITRSTSDTCGRDSKQNIRESIDLEIQYGDRDEPESSTEGYQESCSLPCRTVNSFAKGGDKQKDKCKKSSDNKKSMPSSCSNANTSRGRRNQNGLNKNNPKEEHAGAAKRMFAHALGLQPSKGASLQTPVTSFSASNENGYR